MCQDYALLFIRNDFKLFTRCSHLPVRELSTIRGNLPRASLRLYLFPIFVVPWCKLYIHRLELLRSHTPHGWPAHTRHMVGPLTHATWLASPIDSCMAYCHASCLVDHDRRAKSSAHLQPVFRPSALSAQLAVIGSTLSFTYLFQFSICRGSLLRSLANRRPSSVNDSTSTELTI